MHVNDDDVKRRGDRAAAAEDDAGQASFNDEESIEIVDVTATDEAGVTLEDEGPEIVIEEESPVRAAPNTSAEDFAQAEARAREAEARAGELHDQLRRTAADFENFRKRVERDRADDRKQAAQSLVRSLLPVLDNFERAVRQGEQAAGDGAASASFVEGVRLIQTQLFDILRAAGLEPVEATGPFDPNVHEALMQEPTTDHPHMSVTDVFEPGYKLHGKLLRPARVKVAWNPGGGGSAE